MPADTLESDVGSATLPQRLGAVALLLERERERFFLWSPVCLGLGIAAYFAMPVEPRLATALAPLLVVLILRAVSSGGTVAAAALMALILAGLGFADAKLRVETVRAPVLAKPLHNVDVSG